MKNLSLPLLFAAILVGPWNAHAKLNVVATLPDYRAIAEEIGGDKVKVTSLAKGTEDQIGRASCRERVCLAV